VYSRQAIFFLDNLIKLLRIKKTRFLNKNNKNNKPLTIVFLCQVPSLWNSIKPVFDEAVERGIKVYILAVPEKKRGSDNSITQDVYIENKSYEFCKTFFSNVINSYDKSNNKWFNISKLKPDYVFLPRPYDSYLPKCYRSSYLTRYTKVCYINYAYNFENYADKLIYKIDFIKNIYLLFAESENSKSYITQTLDHYKYTWNKTIYLGFPRFTLINTKMSQRGDLNISILWTPRWTTNENVCTSTFFNYKEKLFSFIKSNKQYSLIFRPHPLLFQNFLATGELTQEAFSSLIKDIEDTPNIYLDESGDYLDSFNKSNMLITDTSGLIIDYYLTGKPVIFCGNGSDFSQPYTEIFNTLYTCNTWDTIRYKIFELSVSDALYEKRKKIMQNFITSKEISKNIVNTLIEDYKGNL
jgi:hypothetical protein